MKRRDFLQRTNIYRPQRSYQYNINAYSTYTMPHSSNIGLRTASVDATLLPARGMSTMIYSTAAAAAAVRSLGHIISAHWANDLKQK